MMRITISPARATHDSERRAVRAAYELTAAEAEIAIQLAKGRNAEAIAAHRRVALSTVRVQIKRILAKLGVKSQIELVARLNHP
jgi:DNA-binding CsgD family transcriptional regulator